MSTTTVIRRCRAYRGTAIRTTTRRTASPKRCIKIFQQMIGIACGRF